MKNDELVLLGEMADLAGGGVKIWMLDRLASKGAIPFTKVGRFRACRVADVEKIREACAKAGYYKPAAEMTPVT